MLLLFLIICEYWSQERSTSLSRGAWLKTQRAITNVPITSNPYSDIQNSMIQFADRKKRLACFRVF